MNAISIQKLGKRFRRHGNRLRTLKDFAVARQNPFSQNNVFWGLRDISIDITSGKTVGVIGQNGAGKSTLLRLIGGVGRPDEGRVITQGRIGALLDLGSGFHPDLSGRENAIVNGVIAGLTRREVLERFDDIVAFAELEKFIDSPLRTYSSGMQMRLAFAIAAYTDPQILLVDEVLAVGDLAFQQKCLDRIEKFKADGCTIVIVSHDMQQVAEHCDEVIWLRSGQLVAHGPTAPVIAQYVDMMSSETLRVTPSSGPIRTLASGVALEPNTNRFGSLEVEITDVRLLDAVGQSTEAITSGQPLHIEIDYHVPTEVNHIIAGISISREDDTICLDLNTEQVNLKLPTTPGYHTVSLRLQRLDLADGPYFVDIGIYASEWRYAYDYHWHVYPLAVHSSIHTSGVLNPPQHWEIVSTQIYAEQSS